MLVKKRTKVTIFTITAVFCFVFAAVFFMTPHISWAQVSPGLEPLGQELGPVTDIRIIIARVIRLALGLLGTIAVGIVLYGGYMWMTAAGNEERLATAKQILTNGAIGLGIILSAFAITQFVLNSLLGATGLSVTTNRGGGGDPGKGGTLGYGIIESHYPGRNASNIPRNTKIVVTFKEAMDPRTLIDDADGSGTPGDSIGDRAAENVRLLAGGDDLETGPFTAMAAFATEDRRTFVFQPLGLLGSAAQSTPYTVFLTSDVKRADGSAAFELRDDCRGTRGYCWDFEVSTFTDTTPPRVESVIPKASATVARNIVVQMNFSEAIDPTSASGTVAAGFQNITLVPQGSGNAEGIYRISNGYRTVEFTTEPNGLCGVNSCGGNVYCLPENTVLKGTIKAATLASPVSPEAKFPYAGLVDMASNSLDGNGNGQAQGEPADNFIWNFSTNGTIDLVPPSIEILRHTRRDGTALSAPASPLPASLVDVKKPVEMVWSKVMMMSTLKSPNIELTSSDPAWYGWFQMQGKNFLKEEPARACSVTSDCPNAFPLCAEGVCAATADQTTAEILHGDFFEDTEYFPSIGTQVKDIFQNCFYDPSLGAPRGPLPTGAEGRTP